MFVRHRTASALAGILAAGGLLLTSAPASASTAVTLTLNAGGYAVLGQDPLSFPSTALTGVDQTLNKTTTGAIDFSDATGSSTGWNVTAQMSTPFTAISRSVGDGTTTNASPNVGSATAGFVAGDVGMTITGAGIPALARITSITSGVLVVISANATATGSSITLAIGNSRTVADGTTTNLSPNVGSATAAFVSADIGKTVVGAGIPGINTRILSVTSATVVVLSANSTATAGSVGLTIANTLPAATVALHSRTAPLCDTGSTCTTTTDPGTITYPKVIPTTPTGAAKIFNAAVGTGLGNMGAGQLQTWDLGGTIGANSRALQYTATITYTISTGI